MQSETAPITLDGGKSEQKPVELPVSLPLAVNPEAESDPGLVVAIDTSHEAAAAYAGVSEYDLTVTHALVPKESVEGLHKLLLETENGWHVEFKKLKQAFESVFYHMVN